MPAMSRRTVSVAVLVCASLVLAGCALPKLRLPRVHKLTVQQGNVITQEMIDQLKPGMTRNQVAFVMGEPVFRNTFNENRWDYIYTIELPGIFSDERRVSIFFENERLAYFTGDFVPTSERERTAVAEASTTGDGAADTD